MTIPWDPDFIADVEWSLEHGRINQRPSDEDVARARLILDKKVDELLSGVEKNGSRPAPTWYSASDLDGAEISDPRSIVPGVVMVGLNMLCGKGKLGKSWLALDIAVAAATGGKTLTSIPVQQCDVLYLALEDNRRRMQNRLDQLGRGCPPRLTVGHECPKLDEGGMDSIEGWIKGHPEAGLVIIDVWKRVRHKRARNPQLYDEDYEHLVGLQALAQKHELAILVIHHTRKSAAEDVFDEISGSGGILAALDTCVILHRSRNEADGELWVTGRDLEEAHLALSFEAGKWQLLGSADEIARSKERREILETVTGVTGGLLPHEVAKALGKKTENIRHLIWKMHMAGELRRLPNSKYTVAVTGNSDTTGNGGNGGNGGIRGRPLPLPQRDICRREGHKCAKHLVTLDANGRCPVSREEAT